MKITPTAALVGAALCLAAEPALAAGEYVYPSRGQSASKQRADEQDCSGWATKRSGFDPSSPAPAKVEPEKKVTGSGARLIGAGGGAVVAGVAGGNVLTGAVVGGVGGGLVKRVKNRREADKVNKTNAGYYRARQDEWTSARTACLTGRGYSVK